MHDWLQRTAAPTDSKTHSIARPSVPLPLRIFQSLPGASFVVNGARPDADSALVSASAEMKWLNGFSLAATFDGEFSGNVSSYSGKGVLRYTW